MPGQRGHWLPEAGAAASQEAMDGAATPQLAIGFFVS